MKLKQMLAICGGIVVASICFLLYLTMDMAIFPTKSATIQQEFQNNQWLHFENRLKKLESSLNKNHNDVGEIKQAIRQIIAPEDSHPLGNIQEGPEEVKHDFPPASAIIYNQTCSISLHQTPKNHVQMLELYEDIKFDNPDGGVWKQGWKIEVNDNYWNKQNKLKVFVVPHSHNDPGWIRTFEEYYLSQTKHILNNMLEKLQEDPRRKFIWAEISFFAMWWDELDNTAKNIVKRLVHSNQLEIVTGGWVMNDEANSHWLSIVHQLTEGHQWLQRNLNYTPTSSWSIDPFGMSATQPLLLNKAGILNSLIQRVHYSVKKKLALEKQLEFRWRQMWDSKGSTDVFTHMMPFYSYDVPHTCGPDPKICCQFDFKRLPNHGLKCPWHIPPVEINDRNVAERAETLLDQYRKKSQLYKTNVVLAPLGDDFRYDHSTEWDVQYNNYQKLFDHMNANLGLHVHAQFGTLTDYFNAVQKEKSLGEFPSLSGDFFTYADRDDHYWSGYYTSRPFYKRMDRVLLQYIRSAEIILSLAHISGLPGSRLIAEKENNLDRALTEARHSLALFQHHDGITGTAKDAVVNDYGQKMMDAILSCQSVIQQSANLLLAGPGADDPTTDTIFYNIDDVKQTQDTLSEQYTITIGLELNTKKIVIFNSLTINRHEVVTLIVSTANVEVLDQRGAPVVCQVAPIFEHVYSLSTSKYRVSFIAKVPALSLTSYVIRALSDNEIPRGTITSKVKVYNLYAELQKPRGFENINVSPSASDFSIQNSRIVASFNKLGLLKALKTGKHTYPVHLDFARYGARRTNERSGAYLFLPDGDAVPLKIESTVVKVIEGPLYSQVIVVIPYVVHTVTLYNTTGADGLGLEIQNIVDISKTSNFELVMRFATNIKNNDLFYSDLNAYQVVKRKRFKKLPLQANYYPMPSMAYIEDKITRLTLLTATSLGVSSLRDGHIEVMLDRRLNQDDNLGLGQGVLDNKLTRHLFRILVERKTQPCQAQSEDHPSGFPTALAHIASETLQNPLLRLLRTEDEDTVSHSSYSHTSAEFGIDYVLAALKTGIFVKNKEYVGMILHRKHLDTCFMDQKSLEQFPLSHGTVNIKNILPTSSTNSKLNKATLTFLEILESIDVASDISLCPMDVQAYLLHR